MTPMEIVATGLNLRSETVLMATAGGRNPDVLGAFQAIAAREPRHFLVLCASTQTPLARLATKFPFVNFVEFDLPTGKDGFLATNSLLASALLLARAYATALNVSLSIPRSFSKPSKPRRSILRHRRSMCNSRNCGVGTR